MHYSQTYIHLISGTILPLLNSDFLIMKTYQKRQVICPFISEWISLFNLDNELFPLSIKNYKQEYISLKTLALSKRIYFHFTATFNLNKVMPSSYWISHGNGHIQRIAADDTISYLNLKWTLQEKLIKIRSALSI